MRSKWTLLWWDHVKPVATIITFPFIWLGALLFALAGCAVLLFSLWSIAWWLLGGFGP